MVKIYFKPEQIKDFEKGIEYVSSVRGFEISKDGAFVSVEKGDGILVRGENGKYFLTYQDKSDFFRALGTLIGKIEAGEKDFLITEKRALLMCGAMIDCSRKAVMKKDVVIDLMSRMALMGMNTFMLYTEDTYELPGYEYFGYMRGRYTILELKEINEAATSLGLELIPCIQTLGHLATTLRWDYAKNMKDDPDVLLIDEEESYKFIEAMIKTWREITPSDKIHIGMDEAEGVGLGEYLNRNGFCDRFEIMTRHVHRVCDIAKKYGFKPMMWSDMFFKIGSAKRDYYDLETVIPEDLHKMIPDDVSVVYWDYYHHDKDLYLKMLDNHEKLEHDIIFAGGGWVFRGLAPQYDKTFGTTFPALSACREKDVKNIILTMWQDDGAEINIYSMLLGIQLFAEYNYYSEVDEEHLKKQFKLSTGFDADAFLALELDNMEAKRTDNLGTSKQVFYQDILMGLFDKNFACYDLEKVFSEKLQKLENVGDMREFEPMFSYYRALTALLVKKCHLGVKIRKAYKEADKKAILEYAESVAALRPAYRDVYEKLSILWHNTNKPFGFELTENRIGGILLRLEAVEQKLKNYALGVCEKIEELEEEVLWYGGEENAEMLLPIHFYADIQL